MKEQKDKEGFEEDTHREQDYLEGLSAQGDKKALMREEVIKKVGEERAIRLFRLLDTIEVKKPELAKIHKKLQSAIEKYDKASPKSPSSPEYLKARQSIGKLYSFLDSYEDKEAFILYCLELEQITGEPDPVSGLLRITGGVLKELYKRLRPTFALPSHPLMFTLLAMFSAKPERIPRKLLDKPSGDRSPEERREAEEFLKSVIQKETRVTYDENGKPVQEEKQIAIISNSPKVEAWAEITGDLFSKEVAFREEALALQIKRVYGPEGLRHLLGLIIGLEENFRQGSFEWDVNEHLQRLGYKRDPSGAYNIGLKKAATDILRIFASLFVTAIERKKKREVITGERLFSPDGFRIEIFDNTVISERIKLRATDFWYRHAFEPPGGRAPMYTKLLKKIARENHRNHPLTIYTAPLFAIFWRMNPLAKLSIKSIMDWCGLDTRDPHRKKDIRDIEGELNYMKSSGYLGDWMNDGEAPLPSECKDPLKCVLTLTPPAWLQEELKQIGVKRRELLPGPADEGLSLLTQEEFARLYQNSGQGMRQFGNNLGISAQMVSYILRGKRKISQQISNKTREVFGHMLPV